MVRMWFSVYSKTFHSLEHSKSMFDSIEDDLPQVSSLAHPHYYVLTGYSLNQHVICELVNFIIGICYC